ncbi:MAG: hypothetical protein HN487_00180 [Flavobacterium sp.]|nr:hypothetical protein [Flavobacterium sp.]
MNRLIMTKFKVDLKKSILELLMIFLAISISFFIEEWRQDNQLKNRLIEDYNAIIKDLDEDIIQLEKVIKEHNDSNSKGEILMDMLDGKKTFIYEHFIDITRNIGSGNTFFGTTTAYDVSVSSGRLTYFGVNKISHEIGLVYGHHYNRLDVNGKLLDELYILHSNIINRSYLSNKKTKTEIENNKKIIFSNEYRSKLFMFVAIESSYLIKANRALKQMKKVNKLLVEYLSYQ